MRIIAIANQKGGCGKTTTAVNLAASLSINSKKILLLDLDPQAHATLGLNIESDLNIYNVLSKITNKRVRLNEIIKNVSANFDIAPSGMILSTLEQELAGEISRESRLSDVLSDFGSTYDYILIDCPPNLGILTINAICAADTVITPVEASRFSLEGLAQLSDILSLIKDRLDHKVEHKILVTNFDSRLRHSFKILDYIRASFKNKLFGTIVHVNVKLKEAQSNGLHILNYDKYCRGAKDYFSLSRELLTIDKPMQATVKEETVTVKRTEKVKQEIMKKEITDFKERIPHINEFIFSINAPEAKEVHIVGDFNDWKVDRTSFMKQDNGKWIKKLSLDPGKYHYRFVVDGVWTEDPDNPNKETNPFGQMNSLLEVKHD